jgi:microcystin-dependent protein
MADPFVAEIRMFPFNFAPKGWAFCDGQLMPISQNTALFALLGTVYGGDGKSTFALPNLQGAAAMHPGQGQGLSLRDLGEMSGVESITLLVAEIPLHTHGLMADSFDPADLSAPNPNRVLALSQGVAAYQQSNANLAPMAFQALPPAGGSLPHNNMQPYLTLNFCIALQGIFPQRP